MINKEQISIHMRYKHKIVWKLCFKSKLIFFFLNSLNWNDGPQQELVLIIKVPTPHWVPWELWELWYTTLQSITVFQWTRPAGCNLVSYRLRYSPALQSVISNTTYSIVTMLFARKICKWNFYGLTLEEIGRWNIFFYWYRLTKIG